MMSGVRNVQAEFRGDLKRELQGFKRKDTADRPSTLKHEKDGSTIPFYVYQVLLAKSIVDLHGIPCRHRPAVGDSDSGNFVLASRISIVLLLLERRLKGVLLISPFD